MKYDDEERTKNGLAICLRDMGNGSSRIFIDDVSSNKVVNPIDWSFEDFYTFTPELANNNLEKLELTETELANIGLAVVARLLALDERTMTISKEKHNTRL